MQPTWQTVNIIQIFEQPAIGSGTVKYLDVSPSIFKAQGKQLLYYTVTLGERSMKYEIDYTPFLQETHFVYRNCFGVEDTFTCVGEAASEGKFERYYATFGGGYKNFKRKNLREYTVNTGLLTQAAATRLTICTPARKYGYMTSWGQSKRL